MHGDCGSGSVAANYAEPERAGSAVGQASSGAARDRDRDAGRGEEVGT